MEATLINLNDYVLAGGGAVGESYNCPSNPTEMIKLYNEDYPMEQVIGELDLAQKVYSLGIPSPKPGELITDGKRMGIRYFRILNKRSFARAVSQEPERVKEFALEFAELALTLHNTHCPAGLFPTFKEQHLSYLKDSKAFNDEEKAKIAAFLNAAPDSDCAVHGDFHFGNALTDLGNGVPFSEPHKLYFIDLGTFCTGTPHQDLAMFYLVCHLNSEEMTQDFYHMSNALAFEFWQVFAERYFFGEEKMGERYFGEGVTLPEIEKALMPYVGLRALFFENCTGLIVPQFTNYIREYILA